MSKERLIAEKQKIVLENKVKMRLTVLESAKTKRRIVKGPSGRQVSDNEYILLGEEDRGYDISKKVSFDRLIIAF